MQEDQKLIPPQVAVELPAVYSTGGFVQVRTVILSPPSDAPGIHPETSLEDRARTPSPSS